MANTSVFKPAVLFPGTGRLDAQATNGLVSVRDAATSSGVPLELLVDSTPNLPVDFAQSAEEALQDTGNATHFDQETGSAFNVDTTLSQSGHIETNQLTETEDESNPPTGTPDPLALLRKRYLSAASIKARYIPPAPERELGMSSHLDVALCAGELIVIHVGGPNRNMLFIDALAKPATRSDDADEESLGEADEDGLDKDEASNGPKDRFILRASPMPSHIFRLPILSIRICSVGDTQPSPFSKFPFPWMVVQTGNKLLLTSVVRNSSRRVREKGVPLYSLRTLMDFDLGLPVFAEQGEQVGMDPWNGCALGRSSSGICALLVTRRGKLAWWTLTSPTESSFSLDGELPVSDSPWCIQPGPGRGFILWNASRALLLQHRDPDAEDRWEQTLLYTVTPHKAIASQDQITSVICSPPRREGKAIKGLVYISTLTEVVCLDIQLTRSRGQETSPIRPLRSWEHMRGPDPSLTLALLPLAAEDVDVEETWTPPDEEDPLSTFDADPLDGNEDFERESSLSPCPSDDLAWGLDDESVHYHVLLASRHSRVLTAYTPYPLLPSRWAMAQNGLCPPLSKTYWVPSLLPSGMISHSAPVLSPLAALAPGWAMRYDCPYALFQLTHTGAVLIHGLAHRSGTLADLPPLPDVLTKDDDEKGRDDDAEQEEQGLDKPEPVPDGRTRVWTRWTPSDPKYSFPLELCTEIGGPSLVELDMLCSQQATAAMSRELQLHEAVKGNNTRFVDYSHIWTSALKGRLEEIAPGVRTLEDEAALEAWIAAVRKTVGSDTPHSRNGRAPMLLYEFFDSLFDRPLGSNPAPPCMPYTPVAGLVGSKSLQSQYNQALGIVRNAHDVTHLEVGQSSGAPFSQNGEAESVTSPERRAREMLKWDLQLSSSLVETAGASALYTTPRSGASQPQVRSEFRLRPEPGDQLPIQYGQSWAHHCPNPGWEKRENDKYPYLAADSAGALVLQDWPDPLSKDSTTRGTDDILVTIYPGPTQKEVFAAFADSSRHPHRSRSRSVTATPGRTTPARSQTPTTPAAKAMSMSQPLLNSRSVAPQSRAFAQRFNRTSRSAASLMPHSQTQPRTQLPSSQVSASQSQSQQLLPASQLVPGAHADRARKPMPKRRRLGGF